MKRALKIVLLAALTLPLFCNCKKNETAFDPASLHESFSVEIAEPMALYIEYTKDNTFGVNKLYQLSNDLKKELIVPKGFSADDFYASRFFNDIVPLDEDHYIITLTEISEDLINNPDSYYDERSFQSIKYILNKNTGNAYAFGMGGYFSKDMFYRLSGSQFLYIDNGHIVRVDYSDLTAITSTTVSHESDYVNKFKATPSGNIIYNASYAGTEVIKAYSADGTVHKIIYIGADAMYRMDYYASNENYFFSLLKNESETSVVRVSFNPFAIDTLSAPFSGSNGRYSGYIISNNGNFVILDNGRYYDCWDLNTDNVSQLDLDANKYRYVASMGDDIFFYEYDDVTQSKKALFQYNISSHAQSTIVIPEKYWSCSDIIPAKDGTYYFVDNYDKSFLGGYKVSIITPKGESVDILSRSNAAITFMPF